MKRTNVTSINQLPKGFTGELLVGDVDDCIARFSERFPWLVDQQTVYVIPPIQGGKLHRCWFPLEWKGESE